VGAALHILNEGLPVGGSFWGMTAVKEKGSRIKIANTTHTLVVYNPTSFNPVNCVFRTL
jgi:hypothetical protein